MNSDNTSRDILAKGKRLEKIIIAVAAVILIAAFVLVFLNRGRITAITMRIIEFKGNVLLEERGRVKTVKKNARLNGEDVVSTEAGSNVKIGLDEAKIVSLEENSRASISKTGRQLELVVESGILRFEVSKPLEADEMLNIKTTTMIVGIRGTAGTVSSIGDLESVEITKGVVHVIVTNPISGETKELDVNAGEKITVNSKDGSIIDNTEDISEDLTTSDTEEAEDPATADHFELVEVSDELKNSVLTDSCVQVGNVILHRDRTMTIGEAVALLEQDGEVATEKRENGEDRGLTVYRKIPDHPNDWMRDNEILCWLMGPRDFNGESIMDAPLVQVIVSKNSPHRLNVIYPGNVCGLFAYRTTGLSEKSVKVDEYYSDCIDRRREEYNRFVGRTEDEYIMLCKDMCSQAGLIFSHDRMLTGSTSSSYYTYAERQAEYLRIIEFAYPPTWSEGFSANYLILYLTEEERAHIEETEDILVVE